MENEERRMGAELFSSYMSDRRKRISFHQNSTPHSEFPKIELYDCIDFLGIMQVYFCIFFVLAYFYFFLLSHHESNVYTYQVIILYCIVIWKYYRLFFN